MGRGVTNSLEFFSKRGLCINSILLLNDGSVSGATMQAILNVHL